MNLPLSETPKTGFVAPRPKILIPEVVVGVVGGSVVACGVVVADAGVGVVVDAGVVVGVVGGAGVYGAVTNRHCAHRI